MTLSSSSVTIAILASSTANLVMSAFSHPLLLQLLPESMPLPLPAPLLPSNALLQGLPAPSDPLVPYAAFVLAQSRRT